MLSAAGASHTAHKHSSQIAAYTPQMQATQEPEAANALPDYQPELHGPLKTVEHASHQFFSLDMGSMLAASVLGKAADVATNRKDMKYVGRPLGFVGKGLSKVRNVVAAPREFLEKTTVGTALETSAQGAQSLVGKVSKSTAAKMDGWITRAKDTQAWFGTQAERVSGSAATKVEQLVGNHEGLQTRLASLAEGRETALAKAHAKLTGAHITDDMSGFSKWWAKRGTNQVTEMHNVMADFNQHVAVQAGEAGAKAYEFRASVDALHTHLGDFKNLYDTSKTESLIKASKEQLEALKKIHADTTDNNIRATLGRVGMGLESVEKAIEPLNARVGTVAMLRNPAEAVRNIPASLSGMNLHQTAFNGAIAAGSAFTVIRSTKNFHHDMQSLKGMVAALEGTDAGHVSTFHALFANNASPTVKAARAYMFKVYSVETLADIGDVALNLVLMRKGGANNMMTMMPLMMGTAMIPAFMHGHNALTAFGSMDALVKSGQPLGAGAYAQFIQQALPQAKNITADNGLLVELGKHYADMKATPAQMLKEIESNHITEVAAQLQQQLATAGRHAGDPVAAPAVETSKLQVAAQPALHAATVAGTAAMMAHGTRTTPPRTVVGGHTAKLMSASAHHTPTHTAPITSAPIASQHPLSGHDALMSAQPSTQIMAGGVAQHQGIAAANDTHITLQA